MVEAKKIEIELNAFAGMQEDAAGAFAAGEYDEAVRLYFAAVKEAAKLYGSPSNEEIVCLRGLADSFYKLDRFIEAKSVYLQLVEKEEKQGTEETEEAIMARMKLARSLECLQEFDPALAQFKKTLALAEKQFTLGNPSLTTILEAFANMLRKSRKEPQLLSQLEEKARVSRKRYADPENANKNLNDNILADMQKEKAERLKPVWAPKEKISQNSIFYKTGERAQKILDFAHDHPALFRSLLLTPIIVAGIVLSVTLAIALMETRGQIPIPASSPAGAGKQYVSFDRKQKLQFLGNGVALLDSYGKQSKVNYRYARPGWSELLTMMVLSKPGQAWFEIAPEGLKLKPGQILYRPDRLEVDLPNRLEKVAQAVQHLAAKNEAVTVDSLKRSCPESTIKLSDGGINPPQKFESSTTSSADATHVLIGEKHKVLVNTSTLRKNTITFLAEEYREKLKPANKTPDNDGVVEARQNSTCYIVFATGDNGDILFDEKRIAFVEVDELQVLSPIARPADVLDGAPTQIVVGSATPQFILSLYTNILIWTALAVLQIAAFFYIDAFTLSGSKESGLLQTQISAQSMMFMIWTLTFFGILAYGGSIALTYLSR